MSLSKKIFSVKEKEVLSSADLMSAEKANQLKETAHLNKELTQEGNGSTESIDQIASKDLETNSSKATSVSQPASAKLAQTATFKKIEEILEGDLEELYFKMDKTHRRIFKEEGEKTAHQIEQIIATGKVITFKIIALIKHWLNLIPGINKFFIDQESKIKADQIVKSLKH